MARAAGAAVAALLLVLGSGCEDYLEVEVDNPQGLTVAREHVTLTLESGSGPPRVREHDFEVRGNLGRFSVTFPAGTTGRLTIRAETFGQEGQPTGRATETVELRGGPARATLALVRHLGNFGTLLGGQPGGQGDRDGPTGPGSAGVARLDHPVAVAYLEPHAYILERCALRRVTARSEPLAYDVTTLVPCRAGAPHKAGALTDLVLIQPSAIVAERERNRLYIADGDRLLVVEVPPGGGGAVKDHVYWDLATERGVDLRRATGLALGPFREQRSEGGFDTLFVADGPAGRVWALDLQGASPPRHVAGGADGCSGLLPAERAGGGKMAAAQAHLCEPGDLDLAHRGDDRSRWVLLVGDQGHGALRLWDPVEKTVETLVEQPAPVTAVGYKFITVPDFATVGVALLGTPTRIYAHVLHTTNSKRFPLGDTDFVGGDTPGLSESGALFKLVDVGAPLFFDDVQQIFRPLRSDRGDPALGGTELAVVQRGNGVVLSVSSQYDLMPLYGTGPHPGTGNAALGPQPRPAFDRPAGLAWDGSSGVIVADEGNRAVSALAFDATVQPAQGVQVAPLLGCAFEAPAGVAVEVGAAGRAVWVADRDGVRRVALGADGTPAAAETRLVLDGDRVVAASGEVPGCQGAAAFGVTQPGARRLGAIAVDAAGRAGWLARADAPEVVRFSLDGAEPPRAIALPFDHRPPVGLTVFRGRAYTLDADGRVAAVGDRAAHVGVLPLPAPARALTTDGEWLYVADDSPRIWRVDPFAALSIEPPPLAGDGVRGLVLGRPPAFNRVGGLGYDARRGMLLVSDRAENVVVAVQ